MQRQLISFDWAIKTILRNKANFGILEGFLSELLSTDIRILQVLESETNQDDDASKSNRVDLKVEDSKGQIFVIEVQYSRELDYLQRILYSSSKTICEHLKQGEPYSNIRKVISVNILYFNLGVGNDYVYHGTTNFVGIHDHSVLKLSERQKKLYKSEKIANIYPEYYLIEIRNFHDVARDGLDEWIYFLKNEAIKPSFSAKGLKQAEETLNVLRMTKEERIAYEHHLEKLHRDASMYESTYILGKMEGNAEGEMKEKRNTAKRLKQAGMTTSFIMDITSLSEEEIDDL